jgi:hypothetical protein
MGEIDVIPESENSVSSITATAATTMNSSYLETFS